MTESTATPTVLRPATDVFESDEGYRLVADLPGVNADALEVTAHDGLVLIETHGDRVYKREFRFPEQAEVESAKAKLEHGVLELEIPKRPESRPKKIAVSAG